MARTAWTAAAFVAASIACGCGGSERSRDRGFFWWDRPSLEEQVAMLDDRADPDRRREGILLLSDTERGLQDHYLKVYARLLRADPDASVRAAAVTALGRAGDPVYLPNIIEALDDDAAIVRWDAATALDSVHGPAAVEPLQRRAASDPSPDVRCAGAKALGHYPEKRVVRSLIHGLGDEAFCVRYQSLQSLKAITGEDHGYDVEAWGRFAADYEPTARPAPKRPWWDLLGTTE